MINFIRSFGFSFLLLWFTSAGAQSLVFDPIKEVPGNIYAIKQSKSGHLWVGTNKGLVKYNGSSAKYFTTKSQPLKISNNYIVSIFEDSQQRLWCGSRDGLNIINPDLNTNKVLKASRTDSVEGLGHPEVRKVIELSKATFLIGTYGGGLNIYREDKNSYVQFVHNENDPNSIPANNVNDLFRDSRERIWVATETGGLALFDIEKGIFRRYTLENDTSDYTAASIHEDADGKIWVGTWHRGLFLIDDQDSILHSKLAHPDFYDNRNSVRRIAQFDNENLWLGTIGGLLKYNTISGDTSSYFHKEGNSNTISGNVIWSFEKDQEGIWWIGTIHSGLHKYDEFAHKFAPWVINVGELYAPKTQIVHANLMNGSDLWLCTKSHEICIYDCVDKKFKDNTIFDTLSDLRVRSIKRDCKGQTWIVTVGGLFRWNENTSKLDFYDPMFFQQGDVEVGGVYDADVSPNGDLYVVGWGIGLVRIAKSNLLKEDLLPDDLEFINTKGSEEIDPVIWAVTVSKDGLVWLGGKSQSHVYFPKTNTLKRLPSKWSDVQLTKSSDDLWAIESDGHIARVLKNGEWNYLKKIEISKNDHIIHAFADNSKQLWLSTESGEVICTLLDSSGTTKRFNQSDGFPPSKGWNSMVHLPGGEWLFISNEGVLVTDTTRWHFNKFSPPIGLTDIALFERSIFDSTYESRLYHKEKGVFFLNLDYNQNRLEFALEALSFSSSNHITYRYKLTSEEKWHTTSADYPLAKYPKLEHGVHEFYAQAVTADGVVSKEVLLAVISIEAPWWLRWWAFLAYFLLVLGVGWFAFSFSLVSIKAKNKLEFESYRIAKQEELNEEKMHFFTNVSHELKTPLTLILGPINKLLSETNDEKISSTLSNVKRNADHLNELVVELLEFKKIESGLSHLVRETVDVNELIRKVALNYSELAKLKRVDLRLNLLEDSVKAELDIQKFQKVIHNLLSNAFRYAPEGGKVFVTSEIRDVNQMAICVEDTGNGIDSDLVDTIFDRFVTDNKRSGNAGAGTGIGLALAKEIVLAHHGTISAINTDKGARFDVTIPLTSEFVSDTESQKGPLTVPSFDRVTVLVVEDNVEIRKFIVSILEKNYEILTASNGSEALQIARTESPYLILSDVMMPVMDGFELCKTVKSDIQLSHIPVVLLTARTSEADVVQGLENRADDYISKPFDSTVLLLKIRNILDARRLWIQNFKVQQKIEVDASSLTSIDEKFLSDVLSIIEQKLEDTDFNVEGLSKELGMHRSHLTRKLTALTEFSPVEFIRHIRLTKAFELLKTGKLTVSDVAYKVGYDNPRYFSTSFKKQFGKTPTEVLDGFRSI